MHEKKVTWLELFYDLLFVAAISKATHVLLHVEHGIISLEHLIKFVLIFVPIWWAWVGQTVFNNRFGRDVTTHRIFMILQLFFVLIMTASLNVDFDAYYVPFFVGYIGSRILTAIQYVITQKTETAGKQETARFFGTYFWLGIVVSSFSLFFDSWIRYAILYAGIAIDILVPLIGRKQLVKTPIHTAHLLERFALFTLILLGESVISMLSVLQADELTGSSILYAALAFVLVIGIWWQYFENVEKRVDKTKQTAGQTIIYGHLFIYFSLSMIAASIQLLFLDQLNYLFILGFTFGSVLLYFWSVMIVLYRYRFKHLKPTFKVMLLLTSLLLVMFTLNLFMTAAPHIILGEIMIFFIIFAKTTA
ncbi:low temperature requirement protein A [Paenibacillus sp. PL91]|uniref:low temperature requirement protein A n=1 Tax=Paenibacillus sp. PL91 TaxID=2729538 RepID=UPI00145DCD42|nr:low temperature requirement protein A [Paenibacillus sp. PL91]MBC9203010.1 low temperature requirement protein A [Paenibacillus sp. PL91]